MAVVAILAMGALALALPLLAELFLHVLNSVKGALPVEAVALEVPQLVRHFVDKYNKTAAVAVAAVPILLLLLGLVRRGTRAALATGHRSAPVAVVAMTVALSLVAVVTAAVAVGLFLLALARVRKASPPSTTIYVDFSINNNCSRGKAAVEV